MYAFGLNDHIQLGLSGGENYNVPTKIPRLANITQVSAGKSHSIALTTSGIPYSFGSNEYGELGFNRTVSDALPNKIVGVNGVTQIAAGGTHSLLLTSSGEVYGFGNNRVGQLGLGDVTYKEVPNKISGLTGIVQISAGYGYSLLITSSGEVYGFGDNRSGQLGLGGLKYQTSPVKIPGLVNISSIVGGDDHSLALTSSGVAYGFGSSRYGELGIGYELKQQTPVRIRSLEPKTSPIAPAAQETANGYTTRSYNLIPLEPGESRTVSFTAKMNASKVDQFVSNQAWASGEMLPTLTPDNPKKVTASNYKPEGGSALNVAQCTATGYDGDGSAGFAIDSHLCDIIPAKIPGRTDNPGYLSGRLWHDMNKDGIRQNTEELREGATVKIYRGDTIVGEAVTDANGYWSLGNLTPGSDYRIQYSATGEYQGQNWMYTKQNVGSDSTDSDVDKAGQITGITVEAGKVKAYNDAGVYPSVVQLTVDKTTQDDTNRYGDGVNLKVQPNTGLSQERQVKVVVTNKSDSTEAIEDFTFADETTDGPEVKDWKFDSSTGNVSGTPKISEGKVSGLVLEPGASATFIGTLPAMNPGSGHKDTVTVTGTSTETGTPVEAEDDTSATVAGSTPSIMVKKYYNDRVPSAPTGQTLDSQDSDANEKPITVDDERLTVSYVVTNNGNMPLTNITLVDRIGENTNRVTCENAPSKLLPGESFTCVGTQTLIDNKLDSPVTVTGLTRDSDGQPSGVVRDSDDAKAERAMIDFELILPNTGTKIAASIILFVLFGSAMIIIVNMRRRAKL